MTAEELLRAALLAALRADPAIAATNGVFDGAATRVTPPVLELGPLLGADWSCKDRNGRELRTIVTVRDRADDWTRAVGLAGAADAAIRAIARDLDGWRIASIAFVRSRTTADGGGAWRASVEHRVRMMEEL